jgi:hypothetical protein
MPRLARLSALPVAALLTAALGAQEQPRLPVPTPPPAEGGWTEAETREHAAAIEHLTGWMYGRDEAVLEIAANAPTRHVEALLEDPEGRVRAVALVVLYEQLGHRALPTIARYFRDDAEAPPFRMPHAVAWTSAGEASRSFQDQPQQVGQIAQGLVLGYLPNELTGRYVDLSLTIDARVVERAFADYLATRHERAWSWPRIHVLAKRLSGGQQPTATEQLPRLAELRAAIDAAPMPARPWYLLGLARNWELGGANEHLVGEDDAVEALRALEVEDLLRFLGGYGPADVEGLGPSGTDADPVGRDAVGRDPVGRDAVDGDSVDGDSMDGDSVDPDLTAARRGPYPWVAVASFAVDQGDAWLPAERLDAWIALAERHFAVIHQGGRIGLGQDSLVLAGWWITAARLAPERKAEFLARGFDVIPSDQAWMFLQPQRGRLAFAAATMLGEPGIERATRWFFDERPMSPFFDDLGRPEGRVLLRTILEDPRLDRTTPTVMRGLALACNAQAAGDEGEPPFGPREPWDLSHPLGIDHYSNAPEEAAEAWPEQSKALEATMTEWRARMREFAQRLK